MADNVVLGAAVGTGATISTDDLGAGIEVQRVKVQFGADGSATDASTANPLPVDTELPTAAALADGASNPTTSVIGAMLQCYNGTTWDRLRGDLTNGLFVNVKASALPTGAATAAKQPALGTAGTPSADVLSVQGVASMTALKVDGAGVTQPVSGPLTDTQLRATPVPVSGTVTANLGTAAVTNAGTFAVQIAANSSVNVAQVAGTTIDTNSGVKSAGTQRVVLATDQPALTNALKVDGSAVTQPVSATNLSTNTAQVAGTATSVNSGTKDAGTQRVILASDQTVVPISDNAGSVTVDAPVGTPVFTTPTPSTTGGWSQSVFAALTNTKTLIKSSAGTFGGYYTIYNPNSSVAYVQIFDVAATASVTLGTTVRDGLITIPPTSAANLEMTNGVHMANGIVIACTTTATGSTAPGTGLDGTLLFK